VGGPQPWRNGGRGPLTPAERVRRHRERKQRAQAAEALLAFRLVQELSDPELQQLLYERPSQRRAVLYMAGDLARFRERAAELKDAPPLVDAERFPSREDGNAVCGFIHTPRCGLRHGSSPQGPLPLDEEQRKTAIDVTRRRVTDTAGAGTRRRGRRGLRWRSSGRRRWIR